MSDWKIGLTPSATKGTPVIIGPLTAFIAWKRLSKPARAAVEAAYPDSRVQGHAGTLSALYRHGFVEWEDADPASDTGYYLTNAAREVFRWVGEQ